MGANASEQRLKPCPFCGASAHVREIRNCDKIMYSVSCDAEGCYGFESMACFPSLEEAMGEWNRREWPSYVIAHDEEGAGTFLYAPLRSCRMEYDAVHRDYVCTECGEMFYLDQYLPSHSYGAAVYRRYRYCPRCGAMVEGDHEG